MEKHTTFRVGGPADRFVVAQTLKQLLSAIRLLEKTEEPYEVLGRGSNLLVGDRGYRGTILSLRGLSEIRSEGNIITAGAGAALGNVARAALEQSLAGMEFAAGIPGSVGGAMVMNAGAYGGEMREITQSVTILFPDELADTDDSNNAESGIRTLTGEEMRFGYRTSILKESASGSRGIVLSAAFHLMPGDMGAIRSRMDELAAKRLEKQPLEYPSAGSTFKRPEGNFAGKLIEEAGLRGFSVGGAQVSEKHCGFVINRGGASARDIRSLIGEVQERVLEHSGIRLEPEVLFLGEF